MIKRGGRATYTPQGTDGLGFSASLRGILEVLGETLTMIGKIERESSVSFQARYLIHRAWFLGPIQFLAFVSPIYKHILSTEGRAHVRWTNAVLAFLIRVL